MDATVTVNGTGSPLEQMVWLAAIVCAFMVLTNTVSGFEMAVHGTPFNVLVIITW